MAYVNPTYADGTTPPLSASNINDIADNVQDLTVPNGGTGVNSITSGAIVMGDGTDPISELSGTGAVYALSINTPQFGTLPVNCGGTGAITAAAARANLGLTKAGFVISATAPTDTNVLWFNSASSYQLFVYDSADSQWHLSPGGFGA